MDKTVDLICSNISLPISIIIVGVGNADFGNMKRLDGDQGLVSSNGVRAGRDIVQFIPFREMNNDPARLASELLCEVPGQVVQYMTMMGIAPGPRLNLDLRRLIENVGNKKEA